MQKVKIESLKNKINRILLIACEHIFTCETDSVGIIKRAIEQRRCFHYSNLQLLGAKENQCKHA